MSYVSQITCDAPNCTSVKAASNHWWVLRKNGTVFSGLPIKDHAQNVGDRHICSTPCMHTMLELWMQDRMATPVVGPPEMQPRCTCKDAYEVGSGTRCPVHETDEAFGKAIRKEVNYREKERIAKQKENNDRENERIDRPA